MKLRLSATHIDKARPARSARKLTDGAGLYLEITPIGVRGGGSKLWRYRYRIDGKENVFAAGEYCEVLTGETQEQAKVRIASGRMTLEEARNERKNWRALVKAGKHPARERDAERLRQAAASSNSFEAVARQWMEKRAKKWSDYYAHRTKRHLENDVFSHIGHLPINAITAAHLRPVILGVEGRGAETVALALRQLISEVFKYAVAAGMADSDPAAALAGLVERPAIKHRKPLPKGEIPAFVRALDAYTGVTATTIALK